jgi:hypothetical protein
MTTRGVSYSVEDFLDALTEQLDKAQDKLALKVRAGRPLTWALKDLALDLRVFVSVGDRGEVRMQSAGPNEEGASTIHLSLTTITRPMVEENTWALEQETDPRGLGEIRLASELDDRDEQRLSRLGVRTVGQLRRLSKGTDPRQLEAMVGVPVDRLRAALEAAARPSVTEQVVVRNGSKRPLLRIRGANLSDGFQPEVRLDGELVEVLEASPEELLVRPRQHHQEGPLEVLVGTRRATAFFHLDDDEPRADDRAGGYERVDDDAYAHDEIDAARGAAQ